MVRVSFVSLVVCFCQIAAVLGQMSSFSPTETPSFDSVTGYYDSFPLEDHTGSPSWAPTGSPTEGRYSGRELDVDDDNSGEEEVISGSKYLTPSKLTCALALIPAKFIFD